MNEFVGPHCVRELCARTADRLPAALLGPLRPQRVMLCASAYFLLGGLSLLAQNQQVFKGQVCLAPERGVAVLAKTPAAAPCNDDRGKRSSHFTLSIAEKNRAYHLDNTRKARQFAGNTVVVVVGSLDRSTATIYIADIFRALPPRVTRAKSVYIDCDACPRGMSAAWLAAFEELANWGRFDVIPDPKKADLILLLSANPYLGDFVTRDGPDKRPVRVDITYMDVVDPSTGRSFWNDSRQWGSLMVAHATKDLIDQFKEQLQLQEKAGKWPASAGT